MSLMCPVCGLPVLPFGGEDICLDLEHDEDRSWRERERDREWAHDHDEDLIDDPVDVDGGYFP